MESSDGTRANVIVGNHVSYLDIWMMAHAIPDGPPSFLAKVLCWLPSTVVVSVCCALKEWSGAFLVVSFVSRPGCVWRSKAGFLVVTWWPLHS